MLESRGTRGERLRSRESRAPGEAPQPQYPRPGQRVQEASATAWPTEPLSVRPRVAPASAPAETGSASLTASAETSLASRDTDGRTDQPHLKGVSRYDQRTVMPPSKGVKLQVGLSPIGYLHKKKKAPDYV